MQDETTSDTWPVWSSDHYESLARYVNPQTIEGLDLIAFEAEQRRRQASGQRGGKVADANHATAAELYERLAAKSYRYVNEPWSASDRQRLRHARWIDRSGGTCVDFALLMATMAFEAEIAPIVVVGHDPVAGGDDHAFLLLDLERPWDEGAARWPGLETGVGRFAEALPAPFSDGLATGQLLAVDPTEATFGRSSTFETAVEEGRKRLAAFDELILVDVHRLLRQLAQPGHGAEAFPPPPLASPAISRSLPSFPVFTSYPSRAELERRLSGASGLLVLWGRQGTGKSMLAHHLAAAKADGCGWFLPATDASTLTTALAHAYAREHALDAADLEVDATRKEYAANAVDVLNDAPEPWVVVLDNANGDPAELAPWLPTPSRQREQLLIVTTTNEEWCGRSDVVDEEVPGLGDQDLLDEIGDPRLVRLSRGRPLLAKSFARLVAATERLSTDLDALLEHGDISDVDGPRLLWQEIHALLDPATEPTAWLLAWLPPDHVPVELLSRLREDVDPGSARLEELGLVSFRGARDVIGIHRLYVDAIRETLEQRPDDRRRAILTVLESPAGRRHLDELGDRQTVDEIARRLRDDYAADSSARRLAPALREAARLQELHGRIAESSRTYDEVATRLEADLGFQLGSATPEDLPPPTDLDDLLADCLHGRARAPYQHARSDRADLERALANCRLAVALKERVGKGLNGDALRDARIGAARSRALVGLIQRRLAAFLPEDEARRELEAALEVIERSAEERRAYLGPDSPEVARSVFNLGGSRIGLAQRDEPERVAHHLDHAADAYGEALWTRLKLYPRKLHPHIAACRNGLALVAYYRAILQPGLRDQERVDNLRQATVEAENALHDREDLDGLLDGPDSAKSAALLVKILLARQELAASGQRSASIAADAEAEIARMTALRAVEQR